MTQSTAFTLPLPKTFTDAEWKIEAARIRKANAERKAKLEQRNKQKL